MSVPAPPPYGSGSLAEVLPTAAACMRVPGYWDLLSVGKEFRSVVVLLVDGLGWNALQRHGEIAPALAGGRSISAAVPTTTQVGLGSLGTGQPPNVHGIVGASFQVPGHRALLSPLSWPESMSPEFVQPTRTVLEDVAGRGYSVASISARLYEGSGLSRAALRGGQYLGADSFGEKLGELGALLHRDTPFLAYVYWADLDRTGHGHGVDSDHWRGELAQVNHLVERILALLPADVALFITADHGMVDCELADRIYVEDNAHLRDSVLRVGGEPRCRFLYTVKASADEVAHRWREELDKNAWVLTRAEWIAAGLSGPPQSPHGASDVSAVNARLGDVMVLARGNTSLASREVDSVVSSLRGQHGSVTDDELLVPFVVLTGQNT